MRIVILLRRMEYVSTFAGRVCVRTLRNETANMTDLGLLEVRKIMCKAHCSLLPCTNINKFNEARLSFQGERVLICDGWVRGSEEVGVGFFVQKKEGQRKRKLEEKWGNP